MRRNHSEAVRAAHAAYQLAQDRLRAAEGTVSAATDEEHLAQEDWRRSGEPGGTTRLRVAQWNLTSAQAAVERAREEVRLQHERLMALER